MKKKFALIHLGNDEAYGLIFVSGEILKMGHEIKWFDGDSASSLAAMIPWRPDFICFSPLTTFFTKSLQLSRELKRALPHAISVFGGHHVFAVPDSVTMDGIDIVVRGPVYGTIDKIIASPAKAIIDGNLIPVEQMTPSRREYYEGVPRMAGRHRKFIMSHFGCMYNCSYCATSKLRKYYGADIYQKYCLTRRPIPDLINESLIFLDYPTKEVSLEDDDILSGPNIEEWLQQFSLAWKREIGLPTYANVTPATVMGVSDKTLEILAGLVASVQMGVQVARPESLRLFNRAAQTESLVKSAYDRLTSFGFKIKMELIMGLPVDDPVEDAIESIKMVQRIGCGTFVSAFPLMLFPGTDLTQWCIENNIELNDTCNMEFHSGVGSVKFDPITEMRIINLTKLTTFFVKYGINEHWIRSIIDMQPTEQSALGLSKCQYLESLIFRNGPEIEKEFDQILSQMDFKY
jgi:radical SAM superfamily enzyme YgiQ (UPF0313 family)